MSDVTELLLQWNSSDEDARAALMEKIYGELRSIAARHLARERFAIELQPSALVNEAYLRLINMDRVNWQNRTHFLAMSARIMREILIDEARKRGAAKRDGGVQVTFTDSKLHHNDPATDVLMLHAAIERLADADPDRARIVELRYFGGLTIDETAAVVGVSPATVKRSWEVARGWLYHMLQESGED